MKNNLELRNIPNYSLREAAQYLGLPLGTLRSWVQGRYYHTKRGKQYFSPVISINNNKQLSFTNLVEAYVLSSMRRIHQLSLKKIRTGIDYINHNLPTPHPLARIEFETDGIDLFIQQYSELITVSDSGQLGFKEIIKTFLNRIERDEHGLALKLFPFTRFTDVNTPKSVVIDPYISFGKPVLFGTGIPTSILAERYKAGDSINDLVEDYNCEQEKIEEGIRFQISIAV